MTNRRATGVAVPAGWLEGRANAYPARALARLDMFGKSRVVDSMLATEDELRHVTLSQIRPAVAERALDVCIRPLNPEVIDGES